MAIGSYIANAAESERNRRHQSGMQDKSLAMQEYGIDTSATTSANLLDFQKTKFWEDEERKDWAQSYIEDRRKAEETTTQHLSDSRKQLQLWEKENEKYEQTRKDQRPGLWNIITNTAGWTEGKGLGTGGWQQFARGMDDRIWEASPWGLSTEDARGKPTFPVLDESQLSALSPQEYIQYMNLLQQHDPTWSTHQSTTSLLNMANK
jgi:hypothetical protein